MLKTNCGTIMVNKTKFIIDPKTGVPYLETNCHHCDEERILKFQKDSKKYSCPKCKKLIFTLEEKKENK